jgi:DNA-binding MarR family transcriptional regulator
MAENEGGALRELVRILVRNLGILEKSDLSCCGITLVQCHAIVEVGRKGKINLNELADLLHVDKSTMSRTINNLVESGLAARELNGDDRRYVIIQLTQEGQRFFKETETAMETYYRHVLNRIPQEKQAQVLESMELLIEALGSENCC